jgi:hypothetical protein
MNGSILIDVPIRDWSQLPSLEDLTGFESPFFGMTQSAPLHLFHFRGKKKLINRKPIAASEIILNP